MTFPATRLHPEHGSCLVPPRSVQDNIHCSPQLLTSAVNLQPQLAGWLQDLLGIHGQASLPDYE